MRHLIILLTLISFASCSSSKRIVKVPQKRSEQSVSKNVFKDSIQKKDTLTAQDPNRGLIAERTLESPKPAEALNHDTWDNLLQKYVSKNGNVNYKAFKANRSELTHYLNYLGSNTPQDFWTTQDSLAYWINTYNAMTIDLIVRHYPLKSIKDIKKPWEQRFWKLGEKWFNLNEIEHQILRKMNEPRIHFAIVCASYSCPKLQDKAFTALNLNKQLTQATEEFLNDSEKNNISENHLELSKIFQWFAKDFKQEGSLIDFLNTYSKTLISNKAKKSYKTYDWNLNE